MTRLKSLFLEGILIEYMACGDVVPLGTQQVLQEQGLPSSVQGWLGKLWHTVPLTRRPLEVNGLSKGNDC